MSGTIICYGDSNTYGYDPCVMAGDRYPEEDRWTGNSGEGNRLEDRGSRNLRKMYSAYRKSDSICL